MDCIIYVDMDDVLTDYRSRHKEMQTTMMKYPQSQYGFFRNLDPIDGGIESVKEMDSMDGVEVYILTSPSFMNPLSYCEKREWIEKYFGIDFCKKLIICSNKGLMNGDILIDDNIKGKGQEEFIGKLIHYGSSEFPDWESVMKEVIER